MTSATACTKCGRPLQAGDRFCTACGASVSPGASRQAPGVVLDPNAGKGRTDARKQAMLDQVSSATRGRFVVLSELGRGGMATVYLATDVRLDRKVALKVMLPSLTSSEEMIERFGEEARNAARLEHENIVTIYSVEEIGHLNLFVMKFVDGASVAEMLKTHGPLPVDVTRHVISQVASALQYAHGESVVHRDVKPGNVMIDAKGNAIVMDFGISKAMDSANLTQTGALVGTPTHMSPERWRGARAAPASDQYALGVLAYEMLCGAAPFVGPTLELRDMHMTGTPRGIRATRSEVSRDLESAVLRMLAKRPEERFGSLAEVHDAMALPRGSDLAKVRSEALRLSTEARNRARRTAEAVSVSPPPSPSPAPRAHEPPRVDKVPVVAGPPKPLVATAPASPGVPASQAVMNRLADGLVIGKASAKRTLERVSGGMSAVGSVAKTSAARVSGEVRTIAAQARRRLTRIDWSPLARRPWLLAVPLLLVAALLIIAMLASGESANDSPVDSFAIATPRTDTTPAVAPVAPPESTLGPPTLVRISSDARSLAIGSATMLRAYHVIGRDSTRADVRWDVMEPHRAVMDSASGLIRARGPGTVRVIATSEFGTDTIRLLVEPPQPATLAIGPAPPMRVGDSTRLAVTLTDSRGAEIRGAIVRWTTSDERVATVDARGIVVGRGAGSAEITAHSGNHSTSVKVVVHAAAPDPGPSRSPEDIAAAVEAQVRNLAAECIDAIRRRDVPKFESLFSAGNRQEEDNFQRLHTLLANPRHDLQVVGADVSRPVRLTSDRAVFPFRLEVRWRRSTGAVAQEWHEFQAGSSLRDVAWRVDGCRIPGRLR